jgi:hypothetical protein
MSSNSEWEQAKEPNPSRLKRKKSKQTNSSRPESEDKTLKLGPEGKREWK